MRYTGVDTLIFNLFSAKYFLKNQNMINFCKTCGVRYSTCAHTDMACSSVTGERPVFLSSLTVAASVLNNNTWNSFRVVEIRKNTNLRYNMGSSLLCPRKISKHFKAPVFKNKILIFKLNNGFIN